MSLATSILSGEILDIPKCPEWSVLIHRNDNVEYAEALACRAKMRSGRPWIDGTLDDQLYDLIVRFWRKFAPGWLTERADIEETHAHYAIVHHLERAGHYLLNPNKTALVKRIRQMSDPKEYLDRSLRVFTQHGQNWEPTWRCMFEDGWTMSQVKTVLDVDAFDDGPGDHVPTMTYALPGKSIIEFLLNE